MTRVMARMMTTVKMTAMTTAIRTTATAVLRARASTRKMNRAMDCWGRHAAERLSRLLCTRVPVNWSATTPVTLRRTIRLRALRMPLRAVIVPAPMTRRQATPRTLGSALPLCPLLLQRRAMPLPMRAISSTPRLSCRPTFFVRRVMTTWRRSCAACVPSSLSR